MPYTDVKATHYKSSAAKGIAARVVIGKKDGADNFCMRVFEFSPGGHSPQHTHDWEHEMFIHSGTGEIFCNGKWNPVQAGNVAFIPENVEHQIKNNSGELLTIVCLVPGKVPEL